MTDDEPRDAEVSMSDQDEDLVLAPTTEEELRDHALRQVKKRRDFTSHVAVYLIVNVMLVLVWYLATPRSYFWPVWVMAGWGIGLAINAWDVYFRKPITEADIAKEMERLRR